MNRELLITICTATYNRGKLLPLLYESLSKQTCFDFEWVLIDDGSTDRTSEVVAALKEKATFDIYYFKQENQGKHVAINQGVKRAKGSFFYIVDSDDRLPENAIAIVLESIKKIKDDITIAGVVGLKCYFNKLVVGSGSLTSDVICDIFDYRYRYNIKGDRAEVFKTAILRDYPFPIFKNEKFIPESIVWNRIGQDYKMLFFEKNIYECEYLEDGLSAHSMVLRRKYPKGATNLYAELAAISKIGLFNRSKALVNFWRFFFCLKREKKKTFKLLENKYIALLCLPLGALLYVRDHLLIKKNV